MSEEKKRPLLEVGASSLLNVKAEIERALSESKRKNKDKPKREIVASDARNKGVEQRAQKDLLVSQKDRTSGGPSSSHVKQALEKKAKIYDILSGGQGISADVLADEQMSKILDESSVDFVGMMQRRLDRTKKETHSDTRSGNRTITDSNDLVEIIDEFGRSRMVPRSKAKQYGQRPVSRQDSDNDSASSDSSSFGTHGATADDLLRGNRGAAHYNLSLNHEEREQQLLALRQLHDDTLSTRQHASASISQKQKLQLDQRRAHLRQSRERAARRAKKALKRK
ncbi:hypothetical protein H4R99_002628 [Coemansia sp. RSA 1722]|nr:hypothetical protein LPJ57_006380 [Coemansia sp. RSA 486]KAJ2235092.1 hypothetical protein IWW45_002871 [Coemansia sp. RSA 485]KAJ2602628.1 hypothetical protein H4R99_002628 [Coemansia sp. RSA 1722]